MTRPRPLGPDDWQTFRDIRLRSLADSPEAFGSTLEREHAFTEADWRQRVSGTVYVVDHPEVVALGGIFDDEGTLNIWGMWTDPGHRGHGHARAILDALIQDRIEVQLHVNVSNGDARLVYERYGFVGTGQVEPLRKGSGMLIELMLLRRAPIE